MLRTRSRCLSAALGGRATAAGAKLGAPAGKAATLATSATTPGASAPFIRSTVVFAAANALGLGISLATGWHYHLDLLGTGAFAAAAFATAGTELRQRASAACVGLWAVKLAGFLFYRALQTHRDGRLEDVLATSAGATGFWTISLAWGVVVSLPHTLAAGVATASRPAFGRVSDLAGIGLFAAGLCLETAADAQKWQFKSDAATRGGFCDVGVWTLSQHPNWLGNLMLWSGVVLLNAPTLLAAGRPATTLLGALASPLFMVALFYGQATGKVGNAPQLAEAKYGADARFQAYVRDVPLVVPSTGHVLSWLVES